MFIICCSKCVIRNIRISTLCCQAYIFAFSIDWNYLSINLFFEVLKFRCQSSHESRFLLTGLISGILFRASLKSYHRLYFHDLTWIGWLLNVFRLSNFTVILGFLRVWAITLRRCGLRVCFWRCFTWVISITARFRLGITFSHLVN